MLFILNNIVMCNNIISHVIYNKIIHPYIYTQNISLNKKCLLKSTKVSLEKYFFIKSIHISPLFLDQIFNKRKLESVFLYIYVTTDNIEFLREKSLFLFLGFSVDLLSAIRLCIYTSISMIYKWTK